MYADNIHTNKWTNTGKPDFDDQGYNNYDVAYNRVAIVFDKNHSDLTNWVNADPVRKVVSFAGNVGTLPTEPIRYDYDFTEWNTISDGTGDTVNADVPPRKGASGSTEQNRKLLFIDMRDKKC